MFTFFVRKYPFWVNLVSKFKIVFLQWNLILWLIRICREVNGDVNFLRFRPKSSFWTNLVPKCKFVCVMGKLAVRKCRMQWWSSLFPFSIGNTLFGWIWSKNLTFQLKLELGTYNHFIIFWDFLLVEQAFLSPQVKRSVIISNKLVYTSYRTSCRTA